MTVHMQALAKAFYWCLACLERFACKADSSTYTFDALKLEQGGGAGLWGLCPFNCDALIELAENVVSAYRILACNGPLHSTMHMSTGATCSLPLHQDKMTPEVHTSQ